MGKADSSPESTNSEEDSVEKVVADEVGKETERESLSAWLRFSSRSGTAGCIFGF